MTEGNTEPRVIVLTDAQVAQITSRILSEESIDKIAQRVEDRFYVRFGRKVADRVLMLIGIAAAATAAYFGFKGTP